jgi:hypothetical protein
MKRKELGMVIFLVSHIFYQIPWFDNQMKPLAFVLLISSMALAQAGFVTQPYGDQIVSNEGIVTLPQGGIVRDNKRGFSIDAKYIEPLIGAVPYLVRPLDRWGLADSSEGRK